MNKQVVWFDIPTLDLERAKSFYTRVLNINIKDEMQDAPVVVFEHDDNIVSGCLFQSDNDKPSDHDILLYFNVNGRIDAAISLVEESGGKIIKEKHSIGPFGVRALILDSEGNRIALHSE